jgi:hypothetical protein
MKILYFVLFLLILIIKCSKNETLQLNSTDKEEKEHLQERIDEILKKEKWDEQKTITKKQFEKIFKRLFELGKEEVENKEKKLNDNQQQYFDMLLKQIVELVLKDIPEEIDIKKIVDYLDPIKIQQIFGKVLSPENLQNVSTQNEKNKNKDNNNSDL